MKLIDKILLAVLLLVLIAGCVCIVLLEFKVMPFTSISGILMPDMPELAREFIVTICALLLLFILIRLVLAAFFFSGKNSDKEIKKAIITSNELGAAYITIDAIRTIAKRHCMSFRYVYDCQANVVQAGEGVVVSVKIAPYADTKLPEVVASLQTSLKNTVESTAGIKVLEVHVLVMPPVAKKTTAANLN